MASLFLPNADEDESNSEASSVSDDEGPEHRLINVADREVVYLQNKLVRLTREEIHWEDFLPEPKPTNHCRAALNNVEAMETQRESLIFGLFGSFNILVIQYFIKIGTPFCIRFHRIFHIYACFQYKIIVYIFIGHLDQ